jgi:hypothetical protein
MVSLIPDEVTLDVYQINKGLPFNPCRVMYCDILINNFPMENLIVHYSKNTIEIIIV